METISWNWYHMDYWRSLKIALSHLYPSLYLISISIYLYIYQSINTNLSQNKITNQNIKHHKTNLIKTTNDSRKVLMMTSKHNYWNVPSKGNSITFSQNPYFIHSLNIRVVCLWVTLLRNSIYLLSIWVIWYSEKICLYFLIIYVL